MIKFNNVRLEDMRLSREVKIEGLYFAVSLDELQNRTKKGSALSVFDFDYDDEASEIIEEDIKNIVLGNSNALNVCTIDDKRYYLAHADNSGKAYLCSTDGRDAFLKIEDY